MEDRPDKGERACRVGRRAIGRTRTAIAHQLPTAAGPSVTPPGPGVFGFELVGTFVTERLMEPHRIAKGIDVLEHTPPGRFETRNVKIVSKPV
jgi:hypothetical protein